MVTRMKRCIPALALTLLILATLACGESTPTSEPTVRTATPAEAMPESPTAEPATEGEAAADPPATEEPTQPPPTDTPVPQMPIMGEVVEQHGYLLVALAVEDPATRPGILYSSQAGKKLVAVEFIVGNMSGGVFSSNVLYATLVDADGYAYGAESGAVENSLELLDLTPGEKVRGWAGFIVPEDAVPASLKYAISGSTGQTLQVELTAPGGSEAVDAPPFSYAPDPDLAYLGDVVENYGYSLSVTTVEDPATRPGILYSSQAGKKLVAVELVVGNVSGDTFSSNVLYTTLIDAEGYAYRAESGSVEGALELLDAGPGERVRGWAGFIIPDGATPASVKYAIRGSSSQALQVSLAQ